MELRKYQQELKRDIYRQWAEGIKRVLAQLPTGGGKSATLASIVSDANDKGYQVLIIAHRQELLEQLQGTLKRYGIFSGLIKSGYPFTPVPVQVASVQTLVKRLDKIEINPKLIVVDECHHAKASSYVKVLEAYPEARVLGVSATPCRTDGKGLGDIFETLVKGSTIPNLVEQGFLVPPTYYCSRSVIEDSTIRVSGGDYHLGDLSLAVRESKLEGNLVREWEEKAKGLQTIVFAVNVEHSQEIVKAYRMAGIPAHHLDCSTPTDLRKAILAQFALGKIQILSNVAIVSEGFDVPACACVQLARPTKSLALYFQMVGRALRPAEGKSEAIVLDHAGCYAEHGCIMAPINWSLEASKKVVAKEKEAQPDWIEPSQREQKVLNINGEEVLIKVESTGDAAWLAELRRLLEIQQKQSFKPGWVVYNLAKKYELTLEQWRKVGKVLAYKRGWADHFVEGLEAQGIERA